MSNVLKMLSRGGAAAAETDPNFNQTVLLLHGDGTNGAQNNTFLDSSTNNFTITRNPATGPNAPTQGTFSPFSVGAGEWSNFFDGTTDNLSIADNAVLDLGSNNFFIEGWFNFAASVSATGYTLIAKAPSAFNTQASFAFWRNTSNKLRFIFSTDGGGTNLGIIDTTNDFTPTVGQWYHLAVARSGSNFYIFIDGVSQALTTSFTGTATASSSIFDSTTALTIGSFSGNNLNFNGYASNIRLTNGSALYTATFTLSTAPLTTTSQGASSSEVELLTCQSNRFVDNSTANSGTGFTITRNDNVRVTPFSPFAPTAAYSAGTNGGSGYFDGTGDYLQLPLSSALLSNSNFTFEAWIYPFNTNRVTLIAGQGDNSTVSGSSFVFYANGANTSDLYSGASTIYSVTTPAPIVNQWNHVAYVRTGGTFSTYLNGVRIGTRTDLSTNSVNNGATTYQPMIGGNGVSNTNYLTGYIGGSRFLIGSGGYDATGSTINIPTSPLTAITNTSLLLNFTNAGIFDNTGKNNLETVGNAQIDTTTKKYGTGSMEFDGTGDYLLARSNPNCSFETGDFTIEGWLYPTAVTGTDRVIWDTRASSGDSGMVLFITTTGTLSTYTSSDIRITSTSSLSANVWTHFALVRSSGTLAFYLNGTQSGTLSYTTAITCPGRVSIGVRFDNLVPYTGFIDDLRITKGVARYPTEPFPTKEFPDL